MKAFNLVFMSSATLLATSAWAAPSYTSGQFSVDPMHSKVGFEVPHLVISSVDGRFNAYKGDLTLAEKFNDSKVFVEIETKSVDTGMAKRDDHLRSADFFDAQKYPKMVFKSKRIEGTSESFKAIGDLTIKGVTKEVALEGKFLGTVKDGYGNLKVAFQGSTKINRKDYGLAWNSVVEAGPVVGDEITITLKIQAAKNK